MRRFAVIAALLVPAAPAAGAVGLAPVGTFSAPVYVTAPPGDLARVFVVERGGTIRVVNDGVVEPTPFLTIPSGQLKSGGEWGLLGLAFAPDYATSGLFYTYRTAPAADGSSIGSDLVIAEGQSLREVLRIPHRGARNHNGGTIAFGPDGLLYLATGDGGGGGDTFHNGQNTATQLGKMLRLDPQASAAPQLFAYGLRNPYRFSFDRQTDDLLIGDVGQNLVEEVDFLPAGTATPVNFGWNHYEGSQLFSGGDPLNTTGPYVPPVIDKTHSAGWCAIVGGYVVRDPALPGLNGQYVYSDNCLGKIYAATLSASGASGDHDTGLSVPSAAGFGEDGCGRVYVALLSGAVYRLSESGECVLPPAPVPPAPDPPAPDPPAPGEAPGAGGAPAGGGAGEGPAPTPPAGAEPPAPPPVLHLAVGGRRQALRGGRLRLRIRCSAACTARAWSAEAVKARTRRLDAGKPAEFVLRLYRRARRAVAGGGHTTVEVRVTARAAGFPPRRVVVPVLLS